MEQSNKRAAVISAISVQKESKVTSWCCILYLLYAGENVHPDTSKILTALCITSDSMHHCQPQVTKNHDSDPILVQLSHFKKSPNLPLERGQPPFETGSWLLWAVMRIKLLFLNKTWYSHIFIWVQELELHKNTECHCTQTHKYERW